MTFATDLEQLLDKYTTYHSDSLQDDAIRHEWHTCDLCEQSNTEPLYIEHHKDCMAGKAQEVLLND
jgi:hypothetical protein